MTSINSVNATVPGNGEDCLTYWCQILLIYANKSAILHCNPVLLSLRKVLVLVHEDQFINPCPCPWTSSSCPCRGMLLMTMVFGARKPGSVRYNPVLIAWWWALLFRHNTPLCVSDSVYRAMHMRRAVKVIPEKCPTKIFISQFKKKSKISWTI